MLTLINKCIEKSVFLSLKVDFSELSDHIFSVFLFMFILPKLVNIYFSQTTGWTNFN